MKQAIHFIGFRGEEYHSAIRIWGQPDFIHPIWDIRAQIEIVPGDIAIFAKGDDTYRPSIFSHPGIND